MEVKISHSIPERYFIAEVDGERAGLMTYREVSPDVMVINHTEVEPVFENQGIGSKLVVACADYAREIGKRIIPQCSFARAVFNRKKDIQDVLYDM